MQVYCVFSGVKIWQYSDSWSDTIVFVNKPLLNQEIKKESSIKKFQFSFYTLTSIEIQSMISCVASVILTDLRLNLATKRFIVNKLLVNKPFHWLSGFIKDLAVYVTNLSLILSTRFMYLLNFPIDNPRNDQICLTRNYISYINLFIPSKTFSLEKIVSDTCFRNVSDNK